MGFDMTRKAKSGRKIDRKKKLKKGKKRGQRVKQRETGFHRKSFGR